jgi:hypothetical protein
MKKLLIILVLSPLLALAQQWAMTGCPPASIAIPPVTATDTVPSPFVFVDETTASLNVAYTSNTVTINGLTGTATIRVSGGMISKNGGAFSSAQTTITNGNTVTVTAMSPAINSASRNVTVTIGGVNDTYSVTTLSRSYVKDLIGALNSRSWFADESYTNSGLTTPVTHGGEARYVREHSTGVNGNKMSFLATTPTDPIPSLPSSAMTSTFFVAGVGEATYLPYDTADGGFLKAYNGFNKVLESLHSDVGGKLEFTCVFRDKPTEELEFYWSGFQAFRLRDMYGNVVKTGWAGYNEYDLATNVAIPKLGEITIMHMVADMDAKTLTIYKTDSDGEIVQQGVTTSLGVGTYYLRNQYLFSNGHPRNLDWFALTINYGELTAPNRALQVSYFSKIYRIKQMPRGAHCIPTMTTTGTGATRTYHVNLNYNDGGTGLPIDAAATVIRWSYADGKNTNTGNKLDKQSLIRTTNATVLTFVRNDYPTEFPAPHNNSNVLIIDAACKNTANQGHYVFPSAPIYDSAD